VSPFVEGQAIVRLPERAFGIVVRGLDVQREVRVSKLQAYLVLGQLPAQDHEALVGSELASFMGVGPGEAIQLISPVDGTRYPLRVSGVFRSGMYELDRGLIGVTIAMAQQLFRQPGLVNGLSIRLDSIERASEIKAVLASRLGPAYAVKTWMERNQILFDALKLEKLTMFVILTLIVVVAAANIVSTLIMMVIEKTRDIGILKSIGASSRSIRWIFTWQGLVIGALGTGLGFAGAWTIIWLLDRYHFIRLPSTIYYLDHLPVRIEWSDWLATVCAAIVISLLATVYPARQAARLAPVEALRYE
jgi:lipoprotein-releasing system permease protein